MSEGSAAVDRQLAPSAGHWWAVALRGVAAVLFGLMALLWPGITLFALVLLFGVYALVDGAFTLVAAIRDRDAGDTGPGGRGWLIARGVCGIASGMLAVVLPGITALALLWTMAAWAVVTGVFEVVAAIRLRREMRRRRADGPLGPTDAVELPAATAELVVGPVLTRSRRSVSRSSTWEVSGRSCPGPRYAAACVRPDQGTSVRDGCQLPVRSADDRR
jgi:uncharacterized membrane protein HdeD (DUF308 family)